jgi:hypothetical protein
LHQDDISPKLRPPGAIEREDFVEGEGHRRRRETLHLLLPKKAPDVMRDEPAARGEAAAGERPLTGVRHVGQSARCR